MIRKFKLFESKEENLKGNFVKAKESGKIGLVISDRYYDTEFNDYNYDVYYKEMSGMILEEAEGEIELYYDVNFYDIQHFAYIAEKENTIINIPDEYEENFPSQYRRFQQNMKRMKFNL